MIVNLNYVGKPMAFNEHNITNMAYEIFLTHAKGPNYITIKQAYILAETFIREDKERKAVDGPKPPPPMPDYYGYTR